MKTATKKIVTTKTGSINKSICNMLQNCRFAPKTRQIYTGYNSGSGRFTSAHSAMSLVSSILDAQGYSYEKGNDAPRGGITGEYVKVSKTAYNFLVELANSKWIQKI